MSTDEDLELSIARAIVEDALTQGYAVSVYEGEDWALRKGDSVDPIMAALQSTSEDTLHFYYKETGKHVGWVLLIWGNGWDLISDSGGYTEALDRITERAEKIADDAQEKFA